MKVKGIVFVVFCLTCTSIYSQVGKQELFEAVSNFDDVFFVDKCNNRGAIEFFEYEMWSSLDRRGKVVEMEGITDETGKEKVKDLFSRWDIPRLIDLFKMGEGWTYHAEYDPMLYVVRVVIRGGKIVSVNGLTLKGYHCKSKFIHLNNKY